VRKDTLFGQLPEKQDPALWWLTFGGNFSRAPSEAKEIAADVSPLCSKGTETEEHVVKTNKRAIILQKKAFN
jgi:hypothetical protein